MEMCGTIAEMKRFIKTYRLQCDSIPEIAGVLDEFVLRIGADLKFNKRRVKTGPLLNALVLWFMSLPEDERRRLAFDSVANLEAFMAGEGCPAIPLPSNGETGPIAVAEPLSDSTLRRKSS
jgi:hypothetical protein